MAVARGRRRALTVWFRSSALFSSSFFLVQWTLCLTRLALKTTRMLVLSVCTLNLVQPFANARATRRFYFCHFSCCKAEAPTPVLGYSCVLKTKRASLWLDVRVVWTHQDGATFVLVFVFFCFRLFVFQSLDSRYRLMFREETLSEVKCYYLSVWMGSVHVQCCVELERKLRRPGEVPRTLPTVQKVQAWVWFSVTRVEPQRNTNYLWVLLLLSALFLSCPVM